MRYDILIFVQAPADLRHALTIYEKNKEKNFLICVVNIELVYNYVISLPLVNTTFVFYPYIKMSNKNPLSFLKAKKELLSIWKSDFSIHEFNSVYFFSRFYDWFTPGIIGNFLRLKKAKIFYYEHYDNASVKSDCKITRFSFQGLKGFINSQVISYVSNVHFTSRYKIKNLEFRYYDYHIKKIIPSEILIKDNLLIEINENNDKTILFLLSPVEIDMLQESSIRKIKKILIDLKFKKFHLLLKGHPRLGIPQGFKSYFDVIVPNNIPSEFINYNNINVTVGIISSGLNYITLDPDAKVFSIIDVLDFKIMEKQNFYKKYLTGLSANRIMFLNESSFDKEFQ